MGLMTGTVFASHINSNVLAFNGKLQTFSLNTAMAQQKTAFQIAKLHSVSILFTFVLPPLCS